MARKSDLPGSAFDPLPLADHLKASRWTVVNDGVMGGRSSSGVALTADGHTEFSGIVSLENNGGFASAWTTMVMPDAGNGTGLRLRVNGDGKVYYCRLRMDETLESVAYAQEFSTIKDAWMEIDLPFRQFVPRFRGRSVPEAEPLDPARIRQIGFLIGNGQAGPFRLKLEWIGVYR
jgi:NADH dehydrogenase [ubiquinone] 1 alpha subcomplex assembly factor 1